ncbi:MAG TPA: carboxylate--amine ligase [Solibacterales bacterium]|nr:carboxylate--amine ligase [Bryobacterales bacterium]
MCKPRILLVAATTGYQVRSFDAAARQLGVELSLATDRCHILEDPWADRAIPVRFEDPAQSAVQVQGRFDGILAVGDRPALLAAHLAERLGMKFHGPAAVAACGDKHVSRELFAAAGLPTPAHCMLGVHDETFVDLAYPCVLKALHLSASRGVIRADDLGQFCAARDRIAAITREPHLQVETYIPGREFALEGLMRSGRLQCLAIFEKPDPLDGPFFEEAIYVTPPRESPAAQQAIVEATQRAVTALGLSDGPIHAEMRVNASGVWMLEVAARPIGGLCAQTLRFEPGALSLEALLLRHALGEDTLEFIREPQPSGVMMIPVPGHGILQSVEGVEQARAVPGIEDVVITAKLGEELIPLPEGASYPGFLFARADTADAVIDALRRSHAALSFSLTAKLKVLV